VVVVGIGVGGVEIGTCVGVEGVGMGVEEGVRVEVGVSVDPERLIDVVETESGIGVVGVRVGVRVVVLMVAGEEEEGGRDNSCWGGGTRFEG
jgi:hypothetical protein